MKKFFTLTFVGAILSLIVVSCSTSTAGHCDAYGNNNQVPQADLASK